MKRSLIALFSLLLLLSLSNNALACACCAEPGTYFLRTAKPEAFHLELLGEMKFGPSVALYMTEAGFDMIKGLDQISKESENESWVAGSDAFGLVASFTSRTWKFNIKTKTGKSGTLTLPIPSQMVNYKVDAHDTEPNREIELYKELRFKGAVSGGTGIFQSGIVKPTTYFLVFQGRGNGCDNSFDYTHWRLEIEGHKAKYVFFGEMNTPEP